MELAGLLAAFGSWVWRAFLFQWPFAFEITIFVRQLIGASKIRDKGHYFWFHSIVMMMVTCYAGGSLSRMLMGLPPVIFTNDYLFPVAFVAWALIHRCPWDVVYKTLKMPGIREIASLMMEMYRGNSMLNTIELANRTFKPSKYYPMPLFGPILIGAIATSSGNFIPANLGLKNVEYRVPWNIQCGILSSVFYHLAIHDDFMLGSLLRNYLVGPQIDRLTARFIVISFFVVMGQLQIQYGLHFNPFGSVHKVLYKITCTQSAKEVEAMVKKAKEEKEDPGKKLREQAHKALESVEESPRKLPTASTFGKLSSFNLNLQSAGEDKMHRDRSTETLRTPNRPPHLNLESCSHPYSVPSSPPAPSEHGRHQLIHSQSGSCIPRSNSTSINPSGQVDVHHSPTNRVRTFTGASYQGSEAWWADVTNDSMRPPRSPPHAPSEAWWDEARDSRIGTRHSPTNSALMGSEAWWDRQSERSISRQNSCSKNLHRSDFCRKGPTCTKQVVDAVKSNKVERDNGTDICFADVIKAVMIIFIPLMSLGFFAFQQHPSNVLLAGQSLYPGQYLADCTYMSAFRGCSPVIMTFSDEGVLSLYKAASPREAKHSKPIWTSAAPSKKPLPKQCSFSATVTDKGVLTVYEGSSVFWSTKAPKRAHAGSDRPFLQLRESNVVIGTENGIFWSSADKLVSK